MNATQKEMVHEMFIDGKLVEIDAAQLSLIDLADVHQGFKLCPGCSDRYVLIERGYCAGCQAIHASLMDKCPRLDTPGRIDVGTVPFEALEPQALPTPVATAAILFGIFAAGMFALTGMWFVGRGLVGFCLEKGW